MIPEHHPALPEHCRKWHFPYVSYARGEEIGSLDDAFLCLADGTRLRVIADDAARTFNHINVAGMPVIDEQAICEPR
jgi:hypothetical protein